MESFVLEFLFNSFSTYIKIVNLFGFVGVGLEVVSFDLRSWRFQNLFFRVYNAKITVLRCLFKKRYLNR